MSKIHYQVAAINKFALARKILKPLQLQIVTARSEIYHCHCELQQHSLLLDRLR